MAASVALWTAPAFAQDAEGQPEQMPVESDATTGAETAGETEAEAGDVPADLSLGQPVGGEGEIGSTYIAEEFGDWEMRCVRTGEETDPCQLYQLLQDEQGNSVAEISVAPLQGEGNVAAGATAITPLETLLTAELTLSVDGAQARRYPFTWCSAVGCFSRIGFTQAEVDQFKRGNQALIEIRPVAAPDQTVALPVSLTGFTAGYEAVSQNNEVE